MAVSVIHTESLSIGYAGKKTHTVVANNLNLNLQAGQLTALLGANGAGKSTLLRTLTGMQPALGGTVFLDGTPLEQLSENQRAQKRSIVLTDALPPSNLSIFELVALGRQPYTNWLGAMADADKQMVWQALEQVNLTALAHRRQDQVSDGQLQKALIARALAQDTPLILLDEPTTHLDIQHKFALMQLLQDLSHQNGKCILFSTHDIDLALDFCDNLILVLDDGLVQGHVAQLMDSVLLDKLFPDPNIGFDKLQRKFVYKKP